jgi:hypothetical protein
MARAGHHTCIWLQPYKLQLSTVHKIGPTGMGTGSCHIHTIHLPYVRIQAHYSATTSAVMALTCIKVSNQ